MKIKQGILISIGIVLLLLAVGTATAATYTVNNSTGQPADFTSIQDAVNSSSNGDTILVYPGTYTENVDVRKELNITSTDGADNTTVQSSTASYVVYVGTTKNVTISGFTVTGEYNGIWLGKVSNITVTNNKVVDLDYVGIGLSLASENSVTDNIIEHCGQEGIILHAASSNTLVNNKLEYNGRGIYLIYDSKYGNPFNNLIYNNYFNNSGGNVFGSISDNIWNSTEMVTYEYNGLQTNYTGNYYSDYVNHDPSYDTNGDGIGDTPYLEDNYPLMFWPVEQLPINENELEATLGDLEDLIIDEPTLIKKYGDVIDEVTILLENGQDEKAIDILDDLIKTVDKLEKKGELEDWEAKDLIEKAEEIIKLIEDLEE